MNTYVLYLFNKIWKKQKNNPNNYKPMDGIYIFTAFYTLIASVYDDSLQM